MRNRTNKRISFSELMRKNKEELLKNAAELEKIERRIDDKYLSVNKVLEGTK